MPLVQQMQHPKSLDFDNQQLAVSLRKQKMPFRKIAARVRNLQKKKSTPDCVRRACQRFSRKKNLSKYNYHKCGRKAYKVEPEIKTFLIRKLLALRRSCICTSTTLQAELAKEKKVTLSCSWIRKILNKAGYKWRPRAQKRKYNAKDRAVRLTFAKRMVRKGKKGLKDFFSIKVDGTVIPLPPDDDTDRLNFCMHGTSHMWRKDNEAAHPQLAGEDPYGEQVPLEKALPLWAGIGSKGVSEILFHKTKKCGVDEWTDAIRSGTLGAVCRELHTKKQPGPWRILCDGEAFLRSKVCKKLYQSKHIELVVIPRRSPDLNPIEKFWGWLKKELRRLDLQDLKRGRGVLGKTAYRARVRVVLKKKKTQQVAARLSGQLYSACKEVIKKKGAATRG